MEFFQYRLDLHVVIVSDPMDIKPAVSSTAVPRSTKTGLCTLFSVSAEKS